MSIFKRIFRPKSVVVTLSPREFSERLDEHKNRLIETFIDRIKNEVPGADGESRSYLRDHLPQIIDELIDFLRHHGTKQDAMEATALAKKHGAQRAQGYKYTVADLRREYRILRELILNHLREDESLSLKTIELYNAVFDLSLSHATELFVRDSMSDYLQHRADQRQSAEQLESANVERAYAENQQKWLEETFNRIPKPVFLLDLANKKVSFSNRAAKQITGQLEQDEVRLDLYGTEITATDVDGRPLSKDEVPTARIFRGEVLKGDELILTSPSGRYHIKAFSESIPASYGHPASALLLLQDITALKKSEAELRKVQLDLKEAVDIAQVGFWHLDVATQNISVTPILLKQFGIDEKTFKSTLAEAIANIHVDDRERVSSAIQTSIANQLPYKIEYRVVRPDKSLRWIEANGACTYDKAGQPVRFTGTTIDITEKVQARQTLLESAEELRTLADSMPQIVWAAQPSGELDYFNEVWFNYSGSKFEDNVGMGWVKFVHPDDLEQTGERWKISLSTGQPYENEFRLRSKDGTYRWHVARARPISRDGQLQKWYGTNTDIHDQKMLSQSLHEAQDRLELAVESGQMGLWHVDLKTRSVTSSAHTTQLIGQTPALDGDVFEAINRFMHPEDRERASRVLEEAIQNRSDYFDEFRVFTADSKVRWLQSIGRGRYSSDGGSLAGLIRDITDEKFRSEHIEESRRAAERANAAKSQFLANMSHEIRTPLGAIMGFAGLLKDASTSRHEQEGFLSVIERNSNQLMRIIDDILDLSKVEAGMMIVEQIHFSLPEMLTDFSSLIGFKAREKGIDFALKAVTPLPKMVVTDPTRLRQILMNIVGNAIKFTDHGHVEMRVCYKEGYLDFEIQDTGRGISPEQAEHLFKAFTQADTSTTRKYGGTGLGLVLSRSLSEALGGSCEIKNSEIGKGSTFSVKIKVSVDADVEYVTGLGFESEPVRSTSKVGQLSGTRILLVEDSPDNQALISIFLGRAGALIDIASDGAQGYRMALSHPYDFVLMDVQMPIMDGIAAIKKLRSEGYKQPVVALTAHAMVDERNRCLSAGFTDFLSKPVNKDELIELLLSYKKKSN